MPPSEPLIRTKLRLPFIRSALVPRPRLQERIVEGLRRPLTLVAAPAGFGKTTLVASCLAGWEMPVAWFSLDRDDNQPGRFLTYLVAALHGADPRVGGEIGRRMAEREHVPPDELLTTLVNEMDGVAAEIVLVLDDYHVISSPAVHEAVTFLLEHGPLTFHLVLVTRSDPPLPLARWRARGQVVELRAADLSFTEVEAAHFLNDVMGLTLGAEVVAALESRTEGWIAGLQMAALSMRGRDDVTGFIDGFSGTNRYILDYLLDEVLAGQPVEIRRFLLYTSILERLTAPLCDAVLADVDVETREDDRCLPARAPLAVAPSSSILDYVERSNLFLVPLDDERIWYRYHHLFADLLFAQLRQSLDAEGVARLHVRASEWHARHGSILAAIHHAAAAADGARVERFIKQNYRELVSRGEQVWLRAWKDKLSKELVHSRPWLCIYEAYSHSWFGDLDEADRLLDEAEKRLPAAMGDSDARAMQGLLAYVRSRVTAMRGDIRRAIDLCLDARALIPADNLALQLDTHITLAYEYFLHGDDAHVGPFLDETLRLSRASGAVINTVAAACLLARWYVIQGQIQRAYATYEFAAQSIPETGGEHRGARALVEIGLADILCERHELEAALSHLQEGLVLMPWWDKADDFVLAYVTLARIYEALGRTEDARDAVHEATRFVETRGVFSEARIAAEVAQVRLWLALGNLQAAGRWAAARTLPAGPGDPFEFEHEPVHIVRARVFIAQHRFEEAIALLATLEESARSAGRSGRVIEITLLAALAQQDLGDAGCALQALTRSLSLAGPAGYVQLFLDEGRSIQALLARWLAHTDTGPARAYAARLLEHFDADLPGAVASSAEVSSNDALIDPLSSREIEVLHLIAVGCTNQEIADQLFIALGTVKAHTGSIYRKLDVANRTEAVARARQLDILP